MSRRRKAIIALGMVVIAVLAWSFRPRGYTYQGKTVEEWFRDYADASQTDDDYMIVVNAFRAMGTNAAPYLASRIARDFSPPRLEQLVGRLPLPDRFRPQFKAKNLEAFQAASLLCNYSKPPGSMLRELLKRALLSTNGDQRDAAEFATSAWIPE